MGQVAIELQRPDPDVFPAGEPRDVRQQHLLAVLHRTRRERRHRHLELRRSRLQQQRALLGVEADHLDGIGLARVHNQLQGGHRVQVDVRVRHHEKPLLRIDQYGVECHGASVDRELQRQGVDPAVGEMLLYLADGAGMEVLESEADVMEELRRRLPGPLHGLEFRLIFQQLPGLQRVHVRFRPAGPGPGPARLEECQQQRNESDRRAVRDTHFSSSYSASRLL